MTPRERRERQILEKDERTTLKHYQRDASTHRGKVLEGKVVGAQFINGYQYTVIIQHGNFYTVYSNIASINIKRGESVTTGQEIGQVGTERPEMHFEVWRDKQKLNPASWLERR